ncbi:hypothetical protein N4599_02630 [Limosilactobacillus oris]|uniref:hypothetical protein n=2 Tax=Limosilactobacillus TaxID=2742598 RepID=UPI0021B25D2A|nr:hypothetical protein [Limosilactobacillus oris]UXC67858.1 hypothetical protein N4599_02630 [Limosilactobacillus oris]
MFSWVIFMILLTTTNAATTSTAIYSGLIAALVSGVVALIGYSITAFVQSRNGKKAIEAQKEIAQMQRDEKLFYESKLEWANETRKLIAKFVSDSFRLNILVKNIKSMNNKVEKLNFSPSEVDGMSRESSENLHKAGELLSSLNEEVTMIRLYLFRKNDDHEKEVLDMIKALESDMNNQLGINSQLLNEFVNVARDYFNYQMEELKEESA